MALAVKSPPAHAGDTRDMDSIPGRKDPLEEGTAAHSGILAWRVPMDRGAWWATVHRVAKNWRHLKQLGRHARRQRMSTPFPLPPKSCHLTWICAELIGEQPYLSSAFNLSFSYYE